jgi:hypothetical protein
MSQAIVGKRYAHFKDPSHIYQVVEIGVHDSEDLTLRVIYRQMYHSPEYPEGTLWSRRQDSFERGVMGTGFEIVDRFKMLDD